MDDIWGHPEPQTYRIKWKTNAISANYNPIMCLDFKHHKNKTLVFSKKDVSNDHRQYSINIKIWIIDYHHNLIQSEQLIYCQEFHSKYQMSDEN